MPCLGKNLHLEEIQKPQVFHLDSSKTKNNSFKLKIYWEYLCYLFCLDLQSWQILFGGS